MFTTDADFERADWPLIKDGAVSLFWSPTVLAETQRELALIGYEIAVVTCREGQGTFREQFSEVLKWGEQFGYASWGGNLNALEDAFCSYPFGSSGRSALVLDGFHALVAEDKTTAEVVLDMIERWSRNHLIQGKILLGLVQTDDNRYEPVIGSRRPNWNLREWLGLRRGL